MSNRPLKEDEKGFSTIESDSPVDLYWLHRPYKEAGTESEPSLGGKTIISDVFMDDFVIVARACKILDNDATLYDAFNFIREHMLGGWKYIEDSEFIKGIDAQVEREYRKEQKRAKA